MEVKKNLPKLPHASELIIIVNPGENHLILLVNKVNKKELNALLT